MRTKIFRKILTAVLAVVLAMAIIPALTACEGIISGENPCNENTPLMLSISQPEGVFSPFFSGTAMDGQVTGMTQIGMLSSDRDGNLDFGPDSTSVTRDLSMRVIPCEERPGEFITVYQFVIKSGIYFSDGVRLTMDDVLFNLYMLLDPAYVGMSTLNSLDILGLHSYRMQDSYLDDPVAYRERVRGFQQQARNRMTNAIRHLTQPQVFPSTPQIVADIALARPLFDAELEAIWYSVNDDEAIESRREQLYNINHAWEAFFLSVGGILTFELDPHGVRITDNNGFFVFDQRIYNQVVQDFTTLFGANGFNNKDNVIEFARRRFFNANGTATPSFAEVIGGWAISGTIHSHITALVMTDHFEQQQATPVYNIRGIEALDGRDFIASSESLTAAGAASPFEGYEMLQVTIRDVDPRGIWNLGFSVAPMHHYSQPALVAAARAEGAAHRAILREGNKLEIESSQGSRHNFGVRHGDFPGFMRSVMALNGLPMGAGPYMMTDANNNTDRASVQNGFVANNVIHFIRNPYFYRLCPTGTNANIRMLRFQVVEQANILNALADGSIHYADPSATRDSQDFVGARAHLRGLSLRTNGYGYVGISANYIPYLRLRRALMAAIDVGISSEFFPGGLSEPLHRGASLESWVWFEDGREWEEGQISRWAPGISHDDIGHLAPEQRRAESHRIRVEAVTRHLFGVSPGHPDAARYGVGPIISPTQGAIALGGDGRLRWGSGSGAPALDIMCAIMAEV